MGVNYISITLKHYHIMEIRKITNLFEKVTMQAVISPSKTDPTVCSIRYLTLSLLYIMDSPVDFDV